jgi:hypothetical protein
MPIKNQKTVAVFAAEVMDLLRKKAVGAGAAKVLKIVKNLMLFITLVMTLGACKTSNSVLLTGQENDSTVLADSVYIAKLEYNLGGYTSLFSYLIEQDRLDDTLQMQYNPGMRTNIEHIDGTFIHYKEGVAGRCYEGMRRADCKNIDINDYLPIHNISYEHAKHIAALAGKRSDEHFRKKYPNSMRHKKIIGRLPYLSEWLTYYQHHYDKKEPHWHTIECLGEHQTDRIAIAKTANLLSIGCSEAICRNYRSFHLLGSVAEMTEDKYIVGGSFADSLVNCYPDKSLRRYTGAAPLVGFRIAYVIVPR